jgi:hypothetical protein
MTEQDARTALRRFAGAVQKHYGERLRGIYVVDAQDLYDDEDTADAKRSSSSPTGSGVPLMRGRRLFT